MIPKNVTDAMSNITDFAYQSYGKPDEIEGQLKIIYDFLDTSDRYIKDLEQHVDDLVAGQHGDSDYE
jgi:hypothetical protein